MNAILNIILETVIYLASTFLLFFIGKLAYQLIHRKINVKEEVVVKDNFAFILAHVGYYIGLLLAIGSALVGESHGLVADLIDIFIYGLTAIVFLNISIFINQKLIIRKFSVYDEIIRDQNAGMGVIEASNCIATGLIILGAVSGEGGGWVGAVVFWLIGQAMVVLATLVYAWILPYNVYEHIERDNIAVGIGFGGAMIAIANLIRGGLTHDFESYAISFRWIGVEVLIGFMFLPIGRWLTDKILIPDHNLTDEIINQEKPNNGAALIEAFGYIGGSILINWCF